MPFYTKNRRSPTAVTLLPVILCSVVHITVSNAGIVSSPGLQRRSVGQPCTFQWTVNEPVATFSLYNETTGSKAPPSSNGSYNSADGVISLTVARAQLWDAGNYSLSVTTDKATYIDANACLFVYGSLQGSAEITAGTTSPTEGETVEITCNLISNSLPATYRPGISYTWGNSKYGRFQYSPDGTALLWNGDPIPGYTVKNSGRTLRISSVQYRDDQDANCYGSENVQLLGWSSFYTPISLRYRPYITDLNPSSKIFNAIVGSTVVLSFNSQANPPITSTTNWTFANSAGISQDLPPDSVAVYSTNNQFLRFNLSSDAFYGTYSITQTNSIGSTTTAFQVLPESPPNAPSNLGLYYFSHNFVAIQWNLMSSNINTRRQTVTTRLRLSDNDEEIQTINITYYDSFNSTLTYTFNSNIQPLTYYTVSFQSTNSLGSSEIVELKFRTRNQPTLIVSPEMILINGTEAIVNFTVDMGENAESLTSVNAQCCSRLSALCVSNSTVYTGNNQIVLSGIPNGTVYYVDVTVYSGKTPKYSYFSDIVKGVKVSRNGNSESSEVNRSLVVGVVVLASLLGVALVVAIAILSVYLVKRSRRERPQPTKPPPISTNTYLDESHKTRNALPEERPQSNGSDTYEIVEANSSTDYDYYIK